MISVGLPFFFLALYFVAGGFEDFLPFLAFLGSILVMLAALISFIWAANVYPDLTAKVMLCLAGACYSAGICWAVIWFAKWSWRQVK